jgi:methylmalonyl-CoA mutase N-terminal domain/subunit
VANTIDPLAGSYFVEHLTNEIERQAGEYIAKIDRLGGALAAIQAGYPQREIQESAYRYQREVESGRRIVVGVNQYILPAEGHPAILRVDPAVGERQAARLAALRARRNNEEAARLLATLRTTAQGSDNLMPLIIAAVEGYCTLGEISDVLRSVFGEHKEAMVI